MFKKTMAVAAVIAALATSANAAVYSILDVGSFQSAGFNASRVFDVRNHAGNVPIGPYMDGFLTNKRGGAVSGSYDDVSGALTMTGTLASGAVATITGTILFPGNNDNAVIGNLNMTLVGGSIGGKTDFDFGFLDTDYGVGPATAMPNAYDTVADTMTLLGSTRAPRGDGGFAEGEFGIALNFVMSDTPPAPPTIPLPATLPLFLGALLGGSFLLRRRNA